MSNIVYIATSLDGFIADKDGGLDWLQMVPNPEGNDMGYKVLMSRIDALVMGRVTFDTILGFGVEWPYEKPVFVLSNTIEKVPDDLLEKVEIINGNLNDITEILSQRGFKNLYIDGGQTIQSFLQANLIDELIITTIPVILGGGSSLFDSLGKRISLKHIKTEVYLGAIVQSHYKIVR